MPATAICPTSDQLAAFQAGRLTAEELDQIAAHLDTCATCQTALETGSTVGDPLIRELKAARELDAFTEETGCQRVLAKIEAFANSAATHTHDDTASPPLPSGGEGPGARGAAPLQTLGKYQLLEPIGHGGMGEVYKAMHTILKKIVAVKVLPPHRLKNADAVARFRREREAAGRLDHPNIVRAFDADEANGQHFLVMEWLAGEDLTAYVKAHGPLPVEQACDFIRQAALGLAYAHEQGLVHRDVKPSNLFLAKDEGGRMKEEKGIGSSFIPHPSSFSVKVLDLGLALLHADVPAESELTSAGQVMGTYDFIAPEQAMESHTVDARADIYSLGCTFYYLLTAHVPFQGKSDAKKLLAHQLEEPTPLTQYRSDVPAEVLAVLTKMMAKDPARRYASMRDLAASLAVDRETRRQGDKEKETQTVSLSPCPLVSVSPCPPVSLSSQRRPLLIAASLLLGLAAIIALVVGIIRITTPEGDYVIDTDDPDFAFSVSKDTVILEDKLKKRTFKVKAVKNKGGWELEITDPANETVVNALTLSIRRGEKAKGLKMWFDARDKALATKAGPVDDRWTVLTRLFPAEKQLVAVAEKLEDLNPRFDGKFKSHKIEGNLVRELEFSTKFVTNIAPLRALAGLGKLDCRGENDGPLSDLSPLAGMNLTFLDLANTAVADLKPLSALPLAVLGIEGTKVSDLSALKGLKLKHLNCSGTSVANLSPLMGMPLRIVNCSQTPVVDLTPIANPHLSTLECAGTNVMDLSPLVGLTLNRLNCGGTKVTNLAPLKGMPLRELVCDFQPDRDAEILRSITTLVMINNKPAAEFWKEVAAKTIDPAWLKQVAVMTPEKQVDAVAAKLKDLNPGFDGKISDYKIEGKAVTVLRFVTDSVKDISPVQALTGLRALDCSANKGDSQLADLSPLKGMKLMDLAFFNTQVSDLSPLKDMKLATLSMGGTQVRDLSALKGMPLKELTCDFKAERDAETLRSIVTLTRINGKPAAEFWKEVDAKGANEKSPPSGELRRYLGHSAGVTHVEFAPDAKSFLSVSNGEIWLWDVDGATERVRFPNTQGNLLSAGFSKDGQRVVGPAQVGAIAVWDTKAKPGVLAQLKVPSWAEWVALAPDRPYVFYTNPTGGRVYDLEKKAELPMRFLGTWASLSKDGRRLLSADGKTLYLWDADTCKEISNVELPGSIFRVALAHDGRHALAIRGNNVHQWDMIDKKEGKRLDTPTTVHAVAISPDGKRALTGGFDKKIRLWDLSTGTEIHSFDNHTAAVSAVAFSPDGKQALSGSGDKTIRLWQLPADKAEAKVETPVVVDAKGNVVLDIVTKLGVKLRVEVLDVRVANSGPGARLSEILMSRTDTTQYRKTGVGRSGLGRVCLDQGTGVFVFIPIRQIKKIDAEDKQHAVTLVDGAVQKGKLLTTVYAEENKPYNLSDAESIVVLKPQPMVADKSKPITTLLTPTPPIPPLPRGGERGFRLSSYQIQAGRLGFGTRVKMDVEGDKLEPDLADFDKTVVSGTDPKWRIRLTTPKGKETEGNLDIYGFSGANRWWLIGQTPLDWLVVLSSSNGSKGFTIEKAQAEPVLPKGQGDVGEIRTFLGHGGSVHSVAFAPDGKSFLSGGPGEILHWDLVSSKPKQSFVDEAKPLKTFGHSPLVTRIAFSRNGTHIVTGGVEQPVRIWDVAKGKPVKYVDLPKAASHFVAWSPDDKYLLVAPTGSFVRLFAYPSLEESNDRFGGTQGHFSKDGDKLLTLEGNVLQLYHLTPLKRTFVNVRDIQHCALTSDGRFAVCGGLDSLVYVWDMVEKKQIHKMTGHKGTIQALAVSPDGKRALSGAGDSTMRLWDLTTGKELRTFEGHGAPVVGVAFSPDGRLALSAGSTDKSVRLWQLPER